MKPHLLFLLFVGAVYCEKDCNDITIKVNKFISNTQSIYLRWQSDKSCSYKYDVMWYAEGDEDDVGETHLEKDNSEVNVTHLTPNTKYIFVLSTDGTSDNTTLELYTAPKDVQNLKVIETTIHTVTLSWDPPSYGSGNGSWSEACVTLINGTRECNTVNETEYTFTSLASCTNHTYSITSTGYESYLSHEPLRSNGVTLILPTARTVPGEVTELTAQHSYTGIMAMWKAPIWCEAPDCVESYNVNFYTENSSKEYTVPWNITDYRILEVESCAVYHVNVTSIGEGGASEAATVGPLYTAPSMIPVDNIAVSKSTTSWVLITWTPADKGSDCLHQFFLNGQSIDDSSLEKVCVNVTVNDDSKYSYNYTGFKPCENRQVTIYSINNEGVWSDGTIMKMYAAAEDPGPVTNLKTTSGSDFPYTTELTWDPPPESICANRFQVCAHKTNKTGTSCYTAHTKRSYEFRGLYSCTSYTFEVTIWTSFGTKFNTYSTSAVLPYHSTRVMDTLTVTGNDRSTKVMWHVSGNSGTDCIQYYSICWSLRSYSDCTYANNTFKYVVIPENIQRIVDIQVKAIFNDEEESNEVTYHGNRSVRLKTSHLLIIYGYLLHVQQNL